MSFNEWREVTLNEISIGNKGNYGIGASAVEYSKDLYTYLRITDISDDGVLKKDSLMSVDDKNAINYLLKPNDIVFARTGNSTGRSYFYDGSDGELVYAGFLIKFSLDPSDIIPKFIRYYILSNEYKDWVASFSTGSTRGNINAKTYGNMKIKLPPTAQQDFLVKILSTLDQKIEVNNQINKTLENMAQVIFKQWFVDFEFPNEQGESYKSSGGEMFESELGMIPKGWEVSDINTVTKLIIDYRGKTPKKLGKDWSVSGIIALSAKSIKNGKFVNLEQANHVDEELYSLWMKDELEFGDILLTSEAPLGELYFLATNDKYCLSQRLFAIRANTEYMFPEVLYMYLRTTDVMKDIQNRATGTTVTGIRQSELRKVKIIKPNEMIQKSFQELVNKILVKISIAENENFKLRKLRDTILPKLMSGEIRVPLNSGGEAS